MLNLNYEEELTVQDILTKEELERIKKGLSIMGISEEYYEMAIQMINYQMNKDD